MCLCVYICIDIYLFLYIYIHLDRCTHIYTYIHAIYTPTHKTPRYPCSLHTVLLFILPYPLPQLRRAIRKHCGMWEANVFVFWSDLNKKEPNICLKVKMRKQKGTQTHVCVTHMPNHPPVVRLLTSSLVPCTQHGKQSRVFLVQNPA